MDKKWWIIAVCCLCFAFAKAQSEKAQLEARKAKIQQQINQYSRLLNNVKKEANTMVLLVETLDKKIASTQEIINITNKEANLITRSIRNNTKQIDRLQAELKEQKEAYAKMIVKAYKSKNEQSRLMFLLSSEDFLQAYKRVQSLQSYADYRKKQAAEIAEIQAAAKKRSQLDRELRKLIEADIAKANKGKTGAVKNKYFLSPEAKALANKFISNKGKLPYPVDEFLITRYYGDQPHPVLPGIQVYCPGFRLQVPARSKAKAVFKGTVNRIEKSRTGILTVHVRHGNYTSVYRNLKDVNVQTGDEVNTQDELGTIFTDKSGVTEMTFVLMEDTNNVDPSLWMLRF